MKKLMRYFARKRMKEESLLIRNEEPKKEAFQRITLNFVPAKTRVETLEDRKHLVIPMIMLVEGVHSGSSGPLFYGESELSKTPEVWNHKPVVVYHPEGTACDPVVINSRKVGIMMNTKWDAKLKRLQSEAWIEEGRAEKVDKRVSDAIAKNEMMELSTGLYVDSEEKAGEWNGEAYTGVIKNIRPDHLALLPDKIGACSIADGAGFLRNEAHKPDNQKNVLAAAVKWLSNRWGLTDNEMSFSNIREAVNSALRARFSTPNSNTYIWVEDVYSNFVVYDNGGKLFRISYTTSDSGVSLSDEDPIEVVRVTEYRTVTGAKFIGNLDDQPQKENMNKMQKIASILAVTNCGWDQKGLEVLNDAQLDTIHKGVTGNIALPGQQATPVTPPAPAPQPVTPPPAPAATTNAQPAPVTPPAPLTMEAYIAQAPPALQESLRNMHASHEQEKQRLITEITANAASGFTKEELQSWPVENLRRVATLAKPAPQAATPYSMPSYLGLAPSEPVVGNSGPKEEEALTAPVLNFARPRGMKKEEAQAAGK